MSLLLNPDPETQSLKLFPCFPRYATSRQAVTECFRAGLLHPGSITYQLCDLGQVINQQRHSRIAQSSDAACHGL